MNDLLNRDLVEIILKRNELFRLNYSSPEYDMVEEELHEFEDDFIEKHSKFLEGIFSTIHEKYCPETEVMVPIAYVAKKYTVVEDPSGNFLFDPPVNEGLLIDSKAYPGKLLRLVLVPNPVRILLQSGKEIRVEVWTDQ